MKKFSEQIEAFNAKFQARTRATARASVQAVVATAQRTVGAGGRMRIDTGFLRASMQGAIGQMPSGPTGNPEGKKYAAGNQAAGEALSVTLLKWEPNSEEVLYVGWTAGYARYREYHDGFLRGAAEGWKGIVSAMAKKAIHEIP